MGLHHLPTHAMSHAMHACHMPCTTCHVTCCTCMSHAMHHMPCHMLCMHHMPCHMLCMHHMPCHMLCMHHMPCHMPCHISFQVLLKAVPLLVKNKDMRNVLASIYNSLCSMIARDNNRLEEAMVYCQKAGDTSAESSNIHNSLGAMFMQRGRNKDAINAFKKAAALNRSCTVAQYSLALLYINMGEDKLAMESLERVLSVDSTHSGARSQLDQLRKDIP